VGWYVGSFPGSTVSGAQSAAPFPTQVLAAPAQFWPWQTICNGSSSSTTRPTTKCSVALRSTIAAPLIWPTAITWNEALGSP